MEEGRERRWRTWMDAAQRGDSASYEKLLLELLPLVRGFVRRRLDDPAGLEDVVQNVFASVHRARHTYRSERPLTPWLFAIARNACVDWVRAHGRRREVPLDAEGVPEPAVAPEEAGGDALAPRLERALAKLPVAQREAVAMLHLEGLSVAEAAARAGVSRGALKVRAHRGTRALRALLGEWRP